MTPLAAVEDSTLIRSVPAQSESSSGQSVSPPPGFSLSEPVENHASLHGLAGRSPGMRRLILQMRRMAPHLSVATIEGPTGAGRTMAARALHAEGPATERPFVPCLATQFFSSQLESAVEVERGRPASWSELILQQAHGGMLFIDRVDQLSPTQQEMLAEFLHWFDDRHFRTRQLPPGLSGGAYPNTVEAALPSQLVFSCSAPLREVGASNFREDLASRLCAVRFRLPPLTERREDIPLLAQIFIQRFARVYGKAVRGLGPGTIAPLLRHSWPGNVRELEETITAAALDTESQWIRPIDLPALAAHTHGAPKNSGGPEHNGDSDFNLDRAIRNHVAHVLSRTRGNKLRAARLLGISRSTLYRILAAEPGDPLQSRTEQFP